MPKVIFINENISAEVPRGAVLRDVALEQGVEIYRGMWTHFNCRGLGLCGRCRIWVLSSPSTVSKPTLLRERVLHRVHGDLRLACQVRVMGDVEIRTRPLGPAVVKPVDGEPAPSYREAAEQRYIETLEAQKAEAKKKAEEAKKKKEEEAAKAEEEIKQKAAEEAAKAEEETKKKAAEEAAKAEEASWDDVAEELAATAAETKGEAGEDPPPKGAAPGEAAGEEATKSAAEPSSPQS